MFSTGQLIFAAFFVIAFTSITIYSYRKDLALHKLQFKGSYIVVLAFFLFIAFLFLIKLFLKK